MKPKKMAQAKQKTLSKEITKKLEVAYNRGYELGWNKCELRFMNRVKKLKERFRKNRQHHEGYIREVINKIFGTFNKENKNAN